MDTKALEKAEQAVKTAVVEYDKLVAAETDYKDKIAAAKRKALEARTELIRLRKEAIGADIGSLMGSISTRGRKPGASAPGDGSGKKRGRPAKAA